MTLKNSVGTLNANDTSDPFTVAYLGFVPGPAPNTAVFAPSTGSSTTTTEFNQFVTSINARGLKQIGTGADIDFFLNPGLNLTAGTVLTAQYAARSAAIAAAGFPTTPYYSDVNYLWDWYDVGEAFSSNLVGYDMSRTYSSVASMLLNTYKVKTVLRETKKFETPLAKGTMVLGLANLNMSSNAACGANSFQHTLPTWTLANQTDSSPFYTTSSVGFWTRGSSPQQFSPSTVAAAMQRVPLTVRFFQDGKMIMHVESDTGSTFYPVPYTF